LATAGGGAAAADAGAGAAAEAVVFDPSWTYLMLKTLILYGSKLTKKFVSVIGVFA